MKKYRKRRSLSRLILKLSLALFCFAAAASAAWCWHISYRIEDHFSGRRWHVPSKVYSDTTLLFPGQQINRETFFRKLSELGYRSVSGAPDSPGEMRRSGSELEIYLRSLQVPGRQRRSFPAAILFDQSKILSIQDLERGRELPLLELEPEELMRYFGSQREQRRLVSIDQVPDHLTGAVLAAEDSRFYLHHGLDAIGIARAMWTNIRHLAVKQGGSTITQQLAKNYFLTPERSLSRKVQEAFMALTMEAMYSKDEILEIYLNEIYFGQKGTVAVHGVGEAAEFYFGKPASRLTLPESATIAGLIRAPNLYSPYEDRSRCRKRRDAVLRAMYASGRISRRQMRRALETGIETVGYSAYGRKAPYFMDYLAVQLRELYSAESLSRLGLSVYTTLDTQVQAVAEKALERGLSRLEEQNPDLRRGERKLQGAVVVMQPKTGYILAMVGGRDYAASQFNRATRARRQPGSSFKPFVFLSGLDRFTPADKLSNLPGTYEYDGRTWEPRNYAPVGKERIRMRLALAESVNRATVDLAMRVGLEEVVRTARKLGISTPLPAYPSIALGASEVVPLELARAYCAFAAGGLLPHPLSLQEVRDEEGQTLQMRHTSIQRATTPAKSFLVSSMLRSAVANGTASGLKEKGIRFPVAGKTGTTNDSRDAWFIGYTPDILALVWIGFDHGRSVQASGATAALPVWAELMQGVPQHVSGEWFRPPPGVTERTVCTDSGGLARRGCPSTMREYFLESNVPGQCGRHRSRNPVRRVFDGIKKFFRSL
jgi:penicillin-binding protein 1B